MVLVVSTPTWIIPTHAQQQQQKEQQQVEQRQDPQHYDQSSLMVSSLASSSSFRELERKLQQMTKDELERICTERGFELITDELDDDTGQPIVSTHQDYVDAAWQCLQMEDIVLSDLYQQATTPQYSTSSSSQTSFRLDQEEPAGSSGAAAAAAAIAATTIGNTPSDSSNRRRHHHDRSTGTTSSTTRNSRRSSNRMGIVEQDQDWLEHLSIPGILLPKPLQRFLGRLLVRLVGDVKELVMFVRRQLDAIVSVVATGRIMDVVQHTAITARTTTTTNHKCENKHDEGHEQEQQQQEEKKQKPPLECRTD